jgi:alkylation response protein AidB-like acyl-CoA dehydrogenase
MEQHAFEIGPVTRTAYGGVRLSGEVTAVVPSTDGILMVSTPSISCLLDAETLGVGIELVQWLDPSTRHSTVAFDDVTVAADRIVSDAGDELERQSRLAWVLQAAELTVLMDAVFALTLNWLAGRWSFGRPLASYQAIKHRCADMKMRLEASHAISEAAAEEPHQTRARQACWRVPRRSTPPNTPSNSSRTARNFTSSRTES